MSYFTFTYSFSDTLSFCRSMFLTYGRFPSARSASFNIYCRAGGSVLSFILHLSPFLSDFWSSSFWNSGKFLLLLHFWKIVSLDVNSSLVGISFHTLFFGHTACGTLIPPTGLEPGLWAVRAWIPNHWTTRDSLFPHFEYLAFFLVLLSLFLMRTVCYFILVPLKESCFFFFLKIFSLFAVFCSLYMMWLGVDIVVFTSFVFYELLRPLIWSLSLILESSQPLFPQLFLFHSLLILLLMSQLCTWYTF